MHALRLGLNALIPILVLVAVGLVIVYATTGNRSTSTAPAGPSVPSGAPTPEATTPPLYLGVTRADVEARLGTPTVPGIPIGYGTCPNNPAFSAWLVSYSTNNRLVSLGPRPDCTDNPPAWRDWAAQFLPPDAHFVTEGDLYGVLTRTYTSAGLAARVGCGTIHVSGSDDPATFNATLAC